MVGATSIDGVVLHHDVGRDFQVLRQFTDHLRERAPEVQLELLVNESCLHGCASRDAHYARLAKAPLGYVEGFQQNCNLPKFQDPSLVLFANWIRPEDMGYYESLGIRRFKIAGREMSGLWLDRAVTAYLVGQYDGNLIDLLTMTPPGLDAKAPDIFFIDNRSLSDFLEQLTTWQAPRGEFYRCLAAKLWQRGSFRVYDPEGLYDLSNGNLRCMQPGRHYLNLRSLQAFTDPAYRTRRLTPVRVIQIATPATDQATTDKALA